jgi:hypothetical protein
MASTATPTLPAGRVLHHCLFLHSRRPGRRDRTGWPDRHNGLRRRGPGLAAAPGLGRPAAARAHLVRRLVSRDAVLAYRLQPPSHRRRDQAIGKAWPRTPGPRQKRTIGRTGCGVERLKGVLTLRLAVRSCLTASDCRATGLRRQGKLLLKSIHGYTAEGMPDYSTSSHSAVRVSFSVSTEVSPSFGEPISKLLGQALVSL